ncbi:putative uncharacterized protein [Aliivibrio wodanis]|uniref:ToxR activated gene A lipoprotein domain-containing protein n=1 Tax=Aliivibrio wodanis TaxID=80852 RepID=A0A090JZ16_9GAMM|nr:putative uncharacterized protein [Aliivibrio wodanis]
MHLVAQRATKVMFKPTEAFASYAEVALTAMDSNGKTLGTLEMKRPDALAQNVMAIPEIIDPNIDFSYNDAAAFNVREVSSEAISAALVDHNVVKLSTWNGHWARDISVPAASAINKGKVFTFNSDSGSGSGYNSNLEINGDVQKFALKNNRRSADNMNKFHVNVARPENPTSASVICDGKVLNSIAISSPKLEPVYTVQGGNEAVRSASLPTNNTPRVLAERYEPKNCDNADHNH